MADYTFKIPLTDMVKTSLEEPGTGFPLKRETREQSKQDYPRVTFVGNTAAYPSDITVLDGYEFVSADVYVYARGDIIYSDEKPIYPQLLINVLKNRVEPENVTYSSVSIHNVQTNATTEIYSSSFSWKYAHFSSDPVRKAWIGLRNGYSIGDGSTEDFYTHISAAYGPYVSVTVTDKTTEAPVPTTPLVFADSKRDVYFAWDISVPDSVFGDYSQIGYTWRWRDAGSDVIAEVSAETSETSYVMPANTWEEFKAYEWQIEYRHQYGSKTSDWISVSTTDAISTCETIAPSNTYVEGGKPQVFQWRHIVSTGALPTGYDLQQSKDAVEWVDVQSGEGEETYCTVEGNTLFSGAIFWRVRTHNANGIAGEWSEPAKIVVLAPPPMPSLRLDSNSPRPQLSWSSENQAGYEVIVGNHESGPVAGTQRSYKVPEYLPDGTVTAMVRISNEYGYWSDWGTVTITIQNAPLPAVTLYADESRSHSARLWWEGAGTMNYIYKDGALIGKTAGNSFEDVMANGAATYQVMATAGDNYVRSTEAKAFVDVRGGLLAGVDGKWFDVGTRFGNAPELAQSDIANVTYMQYAGRSFPVAEIGSGRTRTLAFECAFRSGDPRIRQIEQLTGRRVLYKDENGMAIKGVLETVDWIKTRRMAAASCVIVQLDGAEVIEYDL